ncbi:paired box protein Pax-6-like [Schistocerca piceifrons]|uniref:paired box protein Pax-6-like n=1 Tax=Schistocerca piceifrons TaxID=274613 RepID=UPI001F5EE116|nr:paired box protein Pax-6-like [Schistocerca piceifrons]
MSSGRGSERPQARFTDFSVDRILGLRENSQSHPQEGSRQPTPPTHQPDFQWLHCTRYRPPKLPRTRRNVEDGDQMQRQRRLGRTPRVPFYRWQVTLLEQQYQRHNYLSTTAISELAAMLQLSYNRVKIWFQNRRAKERRKEEMKRIQQEGNDYNRNANLELDSTAQSASPSPSPPAVLPPSPQYRSSKIVSVLPPASHHERTLNSEVSAFSNYQLYHTTAEGMSTVHHQPPATKQCLTDSEYKHIASAV